ncbi:unnamed protein product [Cylicostephanus goldi]|uniref:Uncharacterized protein n=1 Tax=Cylicostephanus goldi TaxID=71465 RepID=A0A3P6SDC0_CYLGO|nr:unnamed protein product [Cylicostephanus goldi]
MLDVVPALFDVPEKPSGNCHRRNQTVDFEERIHVYTSFEDVLLDL